MAGLVLSFGLLQTNAGGPSRTQRHVCPCSFLTSRDGFRPISSVASLERGLHQWRRKVTSTLIITATAFPPIVLGLNLHFFTALIASSSSP